MNADEMKVRLWRTRFLATEDNKVFQKIWHHVKNLSKSPRNFPELSLNEWDAIKMEAVYKALVEFNAHHEVTVTKLVSFPNGRQKIVRVPRVTEMTLISFIRFTMDNAIRNERKTLIRERQHVHLDDSYEDDEDSSIADGVLYRQVRDPSILEPSDAEETERAYKNLIHKVEVALQQQGDPNLFKAFRLRLKNPSITNRAISKKLGISKTQTSGFFREIRRVMDNVIETTDTTLI